MWIPHFPLPPCDLIPLHSTPRTAHLTSKTHTPNPLQARTRGHFSISDMAWTWGAPHAPSPSRTPRQKASSAQMPRDSPSQTTKAPQIPPSKGRTPTSLSSHTPQSRYEMRRLPTILGATTSRPESSVQRPPGKRARTSGPGESSRALRS